MFENILTNFKTKSTRLTDSISVESFKDKSSKISESLYNIRHNLINKTNSLSSYFSSYNCNDSPKNTLSYSTPNLCKETVTNKPLNNIPCGNKVDYVQFNPIADSEEVDDDIVEKFVRVVNVYEDRQSFYRRLSIRRRNDREEIRKRLATGDIDEVSSSDRPGRKPSLQTRLQSGMNLQICFMNDTMSDTESPNSDSEPSMKLVSPKKQPSPLATAASSKPPLPANGNARCSRNGLSLPLNVPQTEADLFAYQAEVKKALAQAKDLARLQMDGERQRRQVSPITEMVRTTLHKVGAVLPQDRTRVSQQMLAHMNVAQLQVIINDLHTHSEYLNEILVKFLMERDDLYMSQDSMLVDIEDLTRYLGAKENTYKEDITYNNNIPLTKTQSNRIMGIVRK